MTLFHFFDWLSHSNAPVKILFHVLIGCFVWLIYLLATDPRWSMNRHLNTVNRMQAQEDHWAEVRAGIIEAKTEEDKAIKAMSDYEFARFLFIGFWGKYEKGWLIGEGKWHKYLNNKFYTSPAEEVPVSSIKRSSILSQNEDLEPETEGTSSPVYDLAVRYNRESSS
jgi:hypothetical protein